MNPQSRKLRLHKSTVRNLTPDHAAHAQGGVYLQPKPSVGDCDVEVTAGCVTARCITGPKNTCELSGCDLMPTGCECDDESIYVCESRNCTANGCP